MKSYLSMWVHFQPIHFCWTISFQVRLAAYLVHDIERGFEELLQGAFLGAAVAGRFPRGRGDLRGLPPFPLLQPPRLGRKVSK